MRLYPPSLAKNPDECPNRSPTRFNAVKKFTISYSLSGPIPFINSGGGIVVGRGSNVLFGAWGGGPYELLGAAAGG